MQNKKSLGQHWLKNRTILDQIATLAKADTSATSCLEIGPGLGTLTSSLLKQFPRVVAVEYDADLARKLPGQFPGKDLTVINADILAVNFADLPLSAPYAVAGNIPYYITSPIIRKMLELHPAPERIVLLIQREVAERLAAEPGHHTWLSLSTQNLATVELGPVVRATEFTPPPKVDSQVVILTPLTEPQVAPPVLALAQRGFASPRKKLASTLAGYGNFTKEQWRDFLTQCTINPDARPADLDLWDWEELESQIPSKSLA